MILKCLLPFIISLSMAFFMLQPDGYSSRAPEKDQAAANTYGSFHTETVSSLDGQLRLEIDDKSPIIVINVFHEKDNALFYSFEAVRKWDFWGVCFEKDNYNIWVQSSDTGTICYQYDDGEWRYNPSAVKPAYIISK